MNPGGKKSWLHFDILYYIQTSSILRFTSCYKGASDVPKACILLAGFVSVAQQHDLIDH